MFDTIYRCLDWEYPCFLKTQWLSSVWAWCCRYRRVDEMPSRESRSSKSTSLRAYQTVVYSPLRQDFTTLKSHGSNNFLLPLNACEVNNTISTMLDSTRYGMCTCMYLISVNSVLPGDFGFRWWARIFFCSTSVHFLTGGLCVIPPAASMQWCHWNEWEGCVFLRRGYCWSKCGLRCEKGNDRPASGEEEEEGAAFLLWLLGSLLKNEAKIDFLLLSHKTWWTN